MKASSRFKPTTSHGDRPERFDDPLLLVAEADDDQFQPMPTSRLDQPRAAGKRRRPAVELEDDLADPFLE